MQVLNKLSDLWKRSSGKEYSSMTCNLPSCLNGAQLMQYSSSDSCKKNIWLRTGNYTLLLLTLKRHSIEYQERLFGGPCENLTLRNGLCSLYRLCITTPEAKLESVTPTVMNLELKLEFITVQYLAISYSSLYSKFCHVSSALRHAGSCCILMTSWSLLRLKMSSEWSWLNRKLIWKPKT